MGNEEMKKIDIDVLAALDRVRLGGYDRKGGWLLFETICKRLPQYTRHDIADATERLYKSGQIEWMSGSSGEDWFRVAPKDRT